MSRDIKTNNIDLSKISDSELEVIIFSEATARWQKVAKIIGDIVVRDRNWNGDGDRLTNCMVSLIESGKLEVAGDVNWWGYSEVRLPHPPTESLVT